MIQRPLIIAIALIVLLSPVEFSEKLALAQEKPTNAARIASALDKSGFRYKKLDDELWEVSFTGENIKDFSVRVVLADDIALVIARIADRKDLVLGNEMLLKLIELNHHFDTAKLALNDEMLYARIDLHVRLVDPEEMKYLIQQTADVANETFPHIKQFLKPQN